MARSSPPSGGRISRSTEYKREEEEEEEEEEEPLAFEVLPSMA